MSLYFYFMLSFFHSAFPPPECNIAFRRGQRHAAAGKCLAPGVSDRGLPALKRAAFVLQQRCHLLFGCQAGHGDGVVILQRLAAAGDAGQRIAAVVLLHLHGNAADHRQGTAVERRKAALAALDKGADGLGQLRTVHRALIRA